MVNKNPYWNEGDDFATMLILIAFISVIGGLVLWSFYIDVYAEKLEPRLKMPYDKMLVCSPGYFMMEAWIADNKLKCHNA